MATVYLIRTQRAGYLCDAAYATAERAAEAAALLSPALGWARVVPLPLLADGDPAPSPPEAPPSAAAPLSLSVAAIGTVTHPTTTAPSGEAQ
jgi:hypothetical protein